MFGAKKATEDHAEVMKVLGQLSNQIAQTDTDINYRGDHVLSTLKQLVDRTEMACNLIVKVNEDLANRLASGTSITEDTAKEILAELKTLHSQFETMNRRIDRLNDAVVENKEGEEDLGTITKM
jgi:phage shock protein A